MHLKTNVRGEASPEYWGEALPLPSLFSSLSHLFHLRREAGQLSSYMSLGKFCKIPNWVCIHHIPIIFAIYYFRSCILIEKIYSCCFNHRLLVERFSTYTWPTYLIITKKFHEISNEVMGVI